MIFTDEIELKDRIALTTGRVPAGTVRILTDTADFMGIQPGNVLRLEDNDYLVSGHATEGRFGIDDQPKFWVKYILDLTTLEKKLVKLIFFEEFTTRIGPFLIRAKRNPDKESRILDLVRGHPHFMQGRTVFDLAGNEVRLIEFVRGSNFYNYLNQISVEHQTYFYDFLPAIIDKLLEALKAMAHLLSSGQQHGDIRNDHLLVEADTGNYVWIDFDYQVNHTDYDLWCLGNIITYAVGKGSHTFHRVSKNAKSYPIPKEGITLTQDDALMVNINQVANLGKLFPYIPRRLNDILRNFSMGAEYSYENIHDLLSDLGEARTFWPT